MLVRAQKMNFIKNGAMYSLALDVASCLNLVFKCFHLANNRLTADATFGWWNNSAL